MADVISELTPDLDRLEANFKERLAAKDEEIASLKAENQSLKDENADLSTQLAAAKVEIDAAEVRGAKTILAECFRRFPAG